MKVPGTRLWVGKMNINDIAKIAGVSRATVSRYLNNGYVSDDKKEKIAKAIQENGYVPSSHARGLRNKKSNVIGVILPKINSDSISREMEGISEVLSEKGYQVLMADTANNEEREVEYIETFKNRQVDGIILISTIFTAEHRKALKSIHIPVVILGQNLKGVSSVYNDDYGAAKEITKMLIRAGCKNIGYIGVTLKDESAGHNRYKGYMDAFKETGSRINENAMITAKFSIEDGYRKAKELFSRCPGIDGLFCATDNIAVGAMEFLKEKKLRIPKDVQVVGFGHTLVSRVVAPKLTTVHFYYKTSGREAAAILLSMIENETSLVRNIQMGYEIIKQESTVEKYFDGE